MEIIQTTKITLEDAEIAALQTLKDAYIQCTTMDCNDCDVCPLYTDDSCIGMYADQVLYRQEKERK